MPSPSPPDGRIPDQIGPYRVEGPLGKGGMGEVYRGYDERLDRPVALKRVKAEPSDAEAARERFRREARALARVRHPAVVEVYDWVEGDAADWLVMELVEGRSLRSLIDEGPLGIGRSLEIAREIASGLAAVHAHGIVHRDLKPDNVMSISESHVKLLDFGLAKRVASMDGLTLTETISEEGQILGTVRFMSPEQASGGRIDPRSDLFSLGVLLYEMLTGVSPFRGGNTVETLTRICTVRERPIHEHDPAVPGAVSELVRRMLKKEPERRLQTAAEVVEALDSLAAGLAAGRSAEELRAVLPASELESDSTSVTQVADETAIARFTTLSEEIATLTGSHVRTLLLNDLVGSTKLVEELGDERAAAIFEEHDRAARDLLERNNGREIDKSDGFLMLFERPIDAVRFALGYHAACDALSAEAGVTVASRVGIHVGEVVLRVNTMDDIARGAKALEVEGLAKAMAARFMTLAGTRQTLISRGVYDLARRSAVGSEDLPEGLAWREHGRYHMKGVEEPVEVFEVGVEGSSPLAPPADTKKVKRVREVSGRLSGWRLRGAAALVVVMLVLAGLGARQLWLMREVPPPFYVAVPETQLVMDDSEAPARLKGAAIQAGLLRALQGYEGVAAIEPSARAAALENAAAVAVAMGAQETLASERECIEGNCQIVFKRIRASDGSTSWSHRFTDATMNLLELDLLVAEQVRGGFLDFGLREGVPELQVLPEDYERFLELHQRYRDRENLANVHEEILTELRALQRSSPRFLEPYRLEATILRLRFVETRDASALEPALEAFEKAREIAPTNPHILQRTALLLIEAGRVDEAEPILDQAARFEPGDAELYAIRAMALERRGESSEALAMLRQAAERQGSANLLGDLADMEYRNGDIESARAHLEAALERSPKRFNYLSRLALLELVNGSLERAVELYERLIRQVPEETELTNLGVAYLLLERYDDAVRVFEQALESAPSSPFALLNLADAQFLLGETENARATYERTLERVESDPDPDSLLTVGAQALAHLGREAEAVAAAQKALRGAPDNPQVVYESALIYMLAGERTSALLHARRAMELGVESRWFDFAWFDPLREELLLPAP